ncbi:hematopoietic prostaglandin D synthase-like [Ptychodera flava]|uniref:hematopoietic prostaglandin D synthase-like n=1 Tax=Ptychodera flava TaxID=63121 RepID=UPI00396AACB8
MSAKYKLVCPQVCGLVGSCKLVFALAGIDCDIERIPPEEWKKQKFSGRFPFQAMPILEFDGKTLAQSRAIARYIAKENGLAGKDNLEQAYADSIVDSIYDVVEHVKVWAHEKDPEKKKAVADNIAKNVFPPACSNLERMLVNNNGGDGFFVGDGLTYADTTFLSISERWKKVDPEVLKNFPKLTALAERLKAMPVIAECLK